MKTLTVFTPAYNRAHTLGRTYDSLCRQTCKDFKWLIVDDGSTDGTRQLVNGWIADDKIEIIYIYQENQGMHGAHNTAYKHIDTELNTCIDSDDWMPDDAVEKIVSFWKENGSEKYAGIVGLDITEDEHVIGSVFPKDVKETTLQGFYESGGSGDKKMVYRTAIINQYPDYPIFPGEKYVGLAYKYMLIDQDWKLLTLNEPLVIVEYQPDGSSFSMYKQYWNNPRGFAFFRKTEMLTTHKSKRQFIVCAHYVSSSIISHNWKFLKESPKKLMTLLSVPAGVALFLLIRHKVKSDQKMKFTSKARSHVDDDLYRYEGEKSHKAIVKARYFFFTPGYTLSFFFRKASDSHFAVFRFFWAIGFHFTKFITGIQIPIGTKIGRGLKIGHFGTIVVNPDAIIGDNFNIAQGCLIGNAQGKRKGTPIIGDNVVMGANSIIIGGVKIGNNVLIAPGAFVNFDVPDNAIVIGNPGQVILRESSPTDKYIVYPVK